MQTVFVEERLNHSCWLVKSDSSVATIQLLLPIILDSVTIVLLVHLTNYLLIAVEPSQTESHIQVK